MIKLPHEWLKNASIDAETAYEYNLLPRERSLRPSRLGLSLMQLLLEDFVLWKLADEPTYDDHDAQLKKTMNFSIGYLTEQMCQNHIRNRYPSEQIFSQVKLELNGISGTCDLISVDEETNVVSVWEAKALNVEMLREAKAEKLMTDHWAYQSQLAFYMTAAARVYSASAIRGFWYLWAKKANRPFVYQYPSLAGAFELTDANLSKVDYYNVAKAAYERQDTDTFVNYVLSDPLPTKDGYKSTCALYFNPLHKAFVDGSGYLKEDAKETLTAMTEASYNYTQDNKEQANV